MLKLLLLIPFVLCFGAVAIGVALPLLVIAPMALAIGLAFALPLLLLRFGLAVLGAAGHVFAGLLVLGVAAIGMLLLLVIGVAAAHLLVPIALLVGLVWLLRRAARQPPALAHHPD